MENNNIERDHSESKKKKIIKIVKYTILTVVLTAIFTHTLIYSYKFVIFFILIYLPFSLIAYKLNSKKYEEEKTKNRELYFALNTALIGSIVIASLIFFFSFISNN